MKPLRLLGLLLAYAFNASAEQFKILVAAIPNQYHHDYMPVAKPQFEAMARKH
ncbi:hypothetical protein [Xanthomonas sp. 3075]|uniref:hypothetical protein n=1 Tax=Xanthomonas sp. 3075 TaxID=3035315 RepID=UPI00160CDCFC|nr:hypothetical protein [Xanthomonas sp. 3075]MBB4129726.1 hypothetical protein [Xanthomonas sp. 3075]